MSNEDVFPRRNLPNAAEPWGRKHDEVVRSHARKISNLELMTLGTNRANAGQLGVVGRQIEAISQNQAALELAQAELEAAQGQLTNQQTQITSAQTTLAAQQVTLSNTVDELGNRRTHQRDDVAQLSVSGNATTAPFPSSTRNFTMPAPVGGRRSAVLMFSCVYTSNSSDTPASIFPELLQGGTQIWSGPPVSVPQLTSAPPGWTITTSASIPVKIPSGATPQFSFRIHRVGFTSTTTTVTARDIKVILTYGDTY